MANSGSIAVFFFCLNSIVVVGFLQMPYFLYAGGVFYGLILVAVIAVLAIAAAEWTIEAMARAESYTSGLESEQRCWRVELVRNDRKFEVGELCRLFIHPWIGHIYDVVVVANGFILLCIYGTLAASLWSLEIPFSGKIFEQCDTDDYLHKRHPDGTCWNTYSLCVIFYGIIVVPLSCLDLRWQVIFQTIMGIFRIVVIHLFGVIPVVTFALLVHFMIPTFCISVSNKRHSKRIFTVALTLATVLYLLVGITVAMFYGEDVNETCTLTWLYTTKPGHNILLRIYSYFLFLFPSINLLSSYPLLVNVLVNISFSFVKGVSGVDLTGSVLRIGRFCMATVPLIGSVFVSNLVAVSDYAGLFLTMVLFFVPASLHFASKWKSVKTFGSRTLTEEVGNLKEPSQLIHYRSKYGLSLLQSSNRAADSRERTTAVGAVESCYKPVVGRDVVAIGSLIFGVVAIIATVMSWFTNY